MSKKLKKFKEVKKQNRAKSWVVWLTLLPVITLLGDTYNLWTVINMPSDTFTKLFMAIGSVLVAFGIINNPSAKGKL